MRASRLSRVAGRVAGRAGRASSRGAPRPTRARLGDLVIEYIGHTVHIEHYLKESKKAILVETCNTHCDARATAHLTAAERVARATAWVHA